jgi:hypothetical protein
VRLLYWLHAHLCLLLQEVLLLRLLRAARALLNEWLLFSYWQLLGSALLLLLLLLLLLCLQGFWVYLANAWDLFLPSTARYISCTADASNCHTAAMSSCSSNF